MIEAGDGGEEDRLRPPHTVHCGPDGIYLSALGAPDGGGPGGIFVLDHDTFEPRRTWEQERGPQQLAYDFAWHLGHETTVTSEWGTPEHGARGAQPRAAARAASTATRSTCGTCGRAPTGRSSTWATSTR